MRLLLLGKIVGIAAEGQGLIVGSGILPELVVLIVVQIRHVFGIGGDGPGLVEGVPIVAGGGIQQQGQPYKQYEK